MKHLHTIANLLWVLSFAALNLAQAYELIIKLGCAV
jgi:hypothetical protein